MPRFPEVSPSVGTMISSVYSALAGRLSNYEGEKYRLHIGDTWMEPAMGCRMEDLHVADHPGMHRYAPVQGMPKLLDAIVDRTRARTGVKVDRANVLVTAGATGGLGAVAGALLAPGDEVLVLAPFWPLIAGIVRSFHGVVVPVPFVGELGPGDGAEAAVEVVRPYLTDRTAAIYISTPNNPTGRVFPRSWVEGIVAWAERHGLWVLSDEVYEDYVYAGEHVPALPFAPERTISAHSFSKSYGMAGNRCGYVVGPAEIITQIRKVSTHTFYSTPTAAQIAAERALDGRGDAWVTQAREAYRKLGVAAAERVGVDAPEGSTFLFLDVAPHLDDRGLSGFLEDCLGQGLFVAPGPSFGPYPTHIRACFTAEPPDVVARGFDVLARRMGRI